MGDPIATIWWASWLLQTGFRDIDIHIDPVAGVVGSAVSAFVTTLVIGAIMIAVAPAYTQRMMADLEDEPVGTFVYGVLMLVGLIALTILLIVTILGILLAIPLIMVAILVWAVGASIAYLMIGDRLVGHEDGWAKPLVVGAGLNGLLTITAIGGLATFCIGAAGFGAVIRDWRE